MILADAINEDFSHKDDKKTSSDEVIDLSTPEGQAKLDKFLGGL